MRTVMWFKARQIQPQVDLIAWVLVKAGGPGIESVVFTKPDGVTPAPGHLLEGVVLGDLVASWQVPKSSIDETEWK